MPVSGKSSGGRSGRIFESTSPTGDDRPPVEVHGFDPASSAAAPHVPVRLQRPLPAWVRGPATSARRSRPAIRRRAAPAAATLRVSTSSRSSGPSPSWPRFLGEELALPLIKPKDRSSILVEHDQYTGIARVGPESLRHFKRTYREALKRAVATGTYDPRTR